MKKLWYALWLILLIVLDQFTKLIALDKLKDRDAYPIIKDIFELTYVENRGAAFGMFQGKFIILSIVSMIVIGIICYLFFSIPNEKKYRFLRFTLVLLTAGAIGNLIDRVTRGFVVDFFYFVPINFPVFNVADIYVTCSAAILIFLLLFVYKEEELLKSNK